VIVPSKPNNVPTPRPHPTLTPSTPTHPQQGHAGSTRASTRSDQAP